MKWVLSAQPMPFGIPFWIEKDTYMELLKDYADFAINHQIPERQLQDCFEALWDVIGALDPLYQQRRRGEDGREIKMWFGPCLSFTS